MLAEQLRIEAPRSQRVRRVPGQPIVWGGVAIVVLILAVLWVVVSGMRPAFDAYGWLVWGHQALHLSLDLNAAPSWKPLSFLFTLPYALAGRGAVWLWMATAVAVAFSSPVFAARIAWRLADQRRNRLGASLAAGFAGLGVLGLAGYWHFILIATADPMMVALSLAVIDQHLCGRRRLAWVLLVLLALGRPEPWLLTGLYAAWSWRSHPDMRRALVIGGAALAFLWFGMSRLSSPSWLVAGQVDLRTAVPRPGNRFVGVMNDYFSLYEPPMQLAALFALGYAARRREWTWLIIAGAAAGWLLVDVALGLDNFRASPRYMFEPAAVTVVLAGAAAGRAVSADSWPLRATAVAGLVALGATMASPARTRTRLVHNGIELGRTWTLVIHRLQHAVDRHGAKRILACGQPLTTLSFQSILAWELGVNVGKVQPVSPERLPTSDRLVYFQPNYAGWKIYPVRGRSPACSTLAINTPATGGTPLAARLQ